MPTEQEEFDGLRVVVTGGTRGIGAATVSRLHAGGARVVTVARNAATVSAGVHLVTADLSTQAGVTEAAERALEALGGLDALVNNAGSNRQIADDPLAATDDDWAANLDGNLLGPIRLDRALVPTLVEQGHGSVVHITSGAARYPQTNAVPYAAAKAALNAYSKGLANHVGPHGVRVTAVMPGLVWTDTIDTALKELSERGGRAFDDLAAEVRGRFTIPLGRPGTVAEAAEAAEAAELITFLVSSRASYLTGTQVVLDGGLMPTL